MQRVPSRQREQGISLLEISLAIALLTTLALGTTLLLVPIARQARINRETEIANAEVQKVLERVHATPFVEILDEFPAGSVIPIIPLPDGSIAVEYDDPAADPLVLEVTLSWSSPELGAMTRVFTTLRTE